MRCSRRKTTFEHAPAKRGRKPVDIDVKNLILSMKNDSLLRGVKRSRRTVEARYLAEHKDYLKDSSSLQAVREDPEFTDPKEIPGNTDAIHLRNGLFHRRYDAGEAVSYFRYHLTQNTGDYAVCHH
jgi:hypothetical protein